MGQDEKERTLAELAKQLIAMSDDYLPREVRRGQRKETQAERDTAIRRAAAKAEIVSIN